MDRVTAKCYKNKAVKYMPLGVLNLAANMSDDHYHVSVLDAASLGLNPDEPIEQIESVAPEAPSLLVVTYRALAMIEILRRTSTPYKIVGGAHAVFADDVALILPEWLGSGCPQSVYFGGQVDLDNNPLPARYLLNIDNYRIEKNEELLFDIGTLRLPMFSSKGRPYASTYCDVQQKTFNMKSAAPCIEEFKELIHFGASTSSTPILNNAFTVNRTRVREISRVIINENITVDWSAHGTVDIRADVVSYLADAGCRRLHVGIESLDDGILTTFKKSSRYKHIGKFCRLCEKYGIDILGYFIIGAPGETQEYRSTLPARIRELGIKLPDFNLLSPLAVPLLRTIIARRTFYA